MDALAHGLSPAAPSDAEARPHCPFPSLFLLSAPWLGHQGPHPHFCLGLDPCLGSHMVLSVHHHAFLEGQAPSNVRGAGEAGREPTSSLERRKLRVVSCGINKPPSCLASAMCPGTSSGFKSTPLTSQPPHSSLEQTAAWKAELCSHPTSGAPTCLSPHPLRLTPWSKVCQQSWYSQSYGFSSSHVQM